MKNDVDTLSVVVPVFNEEETINETVRRLKIVQINTSNYLNTDIIFVDDGSKDKTLQILREIASVDPSFKIISFSRNFGHQIAITAGIDSCSSDYVAIIDADLQDPPELLVQMYAMAKKGYDVVYGKRRKRAGETIFKRVTAALFYRVLSYFCEINIPTDTGDFRLMSKRAVDEFKKLREKHRFVRGMVPWVGFKSIACEYDRAERFAGETKYPLRKMIAFAANAIFSFSKKPLTMATGIGFISILIGMIWACYLLYLKLFTNIPIEGMTAILITIIFFAGIQILLIGLMGEYIARIFEEVKGRPLYVVAEKINIS